MDNCQSNYYQSSDYRTINIQLWFFHLWKKNQFKYHENDWFNRKIKWLLVERILFILAGLIWNENWITPKTEKNHFESLKIGISFKLSSLSRFYSGIKSTRIWNNSTYIYSVFRVIQPHPWNGFMNFPGSEWLNEPGRNGSKGAYSVCNGENSTIWFVELLWNLCWNWINHFWVILYGRENRLVVASKLIDWVFIVWSAQQGTLYNLFFCTVD